MLKLGPMIPSAHRSTHVDEPLMLGRSDPGLGFLVLAVNMVSYEQCSLNRVLKRNTRRTCLSWLIDGHFMGRRTTKSSPVFHLRTSWSRWWLLIRPIPQEGAPCIHLTAGVGNIYPYTGLNRFQQQFALTSQADYPGLVQVLCLSSPWAAQMTGKKVHTPYIKRNMLLLNTHFCPGMEPQK